MLRECSAEGTTAEASGGEWPDISPAGSGASKLCGTAMETAPRSACGVRRGSTLKWKRWLLDAINLQ